MLFINASTPHPGLLAPPSFDALVSLKFSERSCVSFDSRDTPKPVTLVPRKVSVVNAGSEATASIESSVTLPEIEIAIIWKASSAVGDGRRECELSSPPVCDVVNLCSKRCGLGARTCSSAQMP